MLDNLLLQFPWRVAKFNSDKSLAGAVLEVLEGTLVPRVVRNYQQKAVTGLDNPSLFLHRQNPTMVSQGMDENDGIFSGLNNLVKIANGTRFHRPGKWPVNPFGRFTLQKIPANQITGRQVLMAGYGHQRNTRLSK